MTCPVKNFKLVALLVFPMILSASWAQTGYWTPTNGLAGVSVRSIAIDSMRGMYAGTDNGLYFSTDEGQNWMLVDPFTLGRLYFIVSSNVVGTFAASGQMVYYMLDGRDSWDSIAWNPANNSLISFTAATDGDIYTATDDYLRRSSDLGLTWQYLFPGGLARCVISGGGFSIVVGCGFLYYHGGRIYVQNGGVYGSNDHGVTWASLGDSRCAYWRLSPGPNNSFFAFRQCANPDNSQIIYTTVWCDSDGLCRVVQDLPTPSAVNCFAFNSESHLFAGTSYGVYRSTNNGNNWIQINNGLGNLSVRSLVIGRDGYIFAGTDDGIYRSTLSTTHAANLGPHSPTEFSLYDNFPNPFNSSTIIGFYVPMTSHVVLRIYNVLGQEVSTPLNELKMPGSYEVIFDGSHLASGVYVCRLGTEQFVKTKKLVLLR